MELIIFIIIWSIIIGFIIVIARSTHITKRRIKTYLKEFNKRKKNEKINHNNENLKT